jgi:hypothetical protein
MRCNKPFRFAPESEIKCEARRAPFTDARDVGSKSKSDGRSGGPAASH